MYSGELEVQAKRKALAVLQDEINRILNPSRFLSTVPKLMLNKDKTGMNLIREGSGFALRFPKFTGKIRYEKSVEDASTPEEVLTLYNRQSKINQEK